jgi:hypothetical protein
MLLAFFLPNAPFVFNGPMAWLRGVTTPMVGQLVNFGSGLVQLTTSNVLFLTQSDYEIFTFVVLVTLLLLYSFKQRALGFLPFIAPALCLFVASRSLQNYFMFWPPALIAFGFGTREAVPLLQTSLTPGKRLSYKALTAAAAVLVVIAASFAVVKVAAKDPLGVALLSYGYDNNTNYVNSLLVRARNNGDMPRSLRFGVYTQGSGVGFTLWRVRPVVLGPRSERRIRLEAPDPQSEFQPGDQSIQVVAIDASSGTTTFSTATEIVRAQRGFANARLASWNAGPPATPAGWEYSASDFAKHRLYRLREGPRNVLAFHIRASSSDEWTLASISQTVGGDLHPFLVDLRPGSSYEGTAFPVSVFGLELVDALGHHAYYTIDARLTHPVVYQRQNFTIFVFPGRLNAWNSIRVDPEQLARDAQFDLSPEAQVRLNVVAAVHKGHAKDVYGEFGGFSST